MQAGSSESVLLVPKSAAEDDERGLAVLSNVVVLVYDEVTEEIVCEIGRSEGK